MNDDNLPEIPDYEEEHPLDRMYEKIKPEPIDTAREVRTVTMGRPRSGDFRPRPLEEIEVPKASPAQDGAALISPELPPSETETPPVTPSTSETTPDGSAPVQPSNSTEDLPF